MGSCGGFDHLERGGDPSSLGGGGGGIPFFKRSWLDPYLLENYQPIFNFPFLAKVVERVGWLTATEDLRRNTLSGPISGTIQDRGSIGRT